MVRSPLPSEVLSQYPTDKVGGASSGSHSYGNFYNQVLAPRRYSTVVMELGIAGGASLRAWREFFPHAIIIGVDNHPPCLVFEPRIYSLCMDCGDPVRMAHLGAEYHRWVDVAIDDASHNIEHQLLMVRSLKRCLKPGGILVVEDVSSASYAPLFEAEGCTVVEFDVANRHDDRIAFFTKEI